MCLCVCVSLSMRVRVCRGRTRGCRFQPIKCGAAQAAEVHRTVRKWAQSRIRPGLKLAEFCEELENMNRRLVKVGVYGREGAV